MISARHRALRKAALGFSTALLMSSFAVGQAPAQVPDSPPAPPAPGNQQPGQGNELPPAIGQQPANRDAAADEAASDTAIEEQIYRDSRNLADPGERALAMARVARAAILSGNLDLARRAVFDGGDAAKLEPVPLIHDQRLNTIITVALSLAEERMRDPIPVGELGDAPPAPANDQMTQSRRDQLKLAAEEWRFSASLARSMTDIVARTEASNRVVEGASFSMQTLRGIPARMGDGGAAPPNPVNEETATFIKSLLRQAAQEAARIERPVWRDRALVSVAQNAASSDQFDLAIEVARMIPQPEIRTDALLRIAENQATNNRQNEATTAYAETARTIAMIPLDDPREVLAGVLIDSLISLGRFDDARASVVLYTHPERRGIALAAVAESQGRRGLADSARKWIAEAPADLQPLLYRKVSDGVLTGLELNRGRLIMRPEGARP